MSEKKKPFNLKQNITFYEQVIVSRTLYLEDIIGCPISEIGKDGAESRLGIICRNIDNTKIYIEWQCGSDYDSEFPITTIFDTDGHLTNDARKIFDRCKIGGE
jgi:hypothetical protein